MSSISQTDYQHKKYSEDTAKAAKTSLDIVGPLMQTKDVVMVKWSESLQNEEKRCHQPA